MWVNKSNGGDEKHQYFGQFEGKETKKVDEKHRGMIRDAMATQSNKWQQKRMKTDNRKTLNVNQGLIDGTQGANKSKKVFPRC